MDQLQNKPAGDVDALLKELEQEEVPAMTAEFEAQAMDRIKERKKELDAEKTDIRPHRTRISLQWRAMIAAAAVFVFLFGGTLLTRGKLRPAAPGSPPGIEQPSFTPTAFRTGEEAQTTSFFGDMGLFVKASLPYLGGAAVIAAVCLVILDIRRKRKK